MKVSAEEAVTAAAATIAAALPQQPPTNFQEWLIQKIVLVIYSLSVP